MIVFLIILLMLAVGGAVYFATRAPATPVHVPGSGAARLIAGLVTAATGPTGVLALTRTTGGTNA